MAIPFARPFFDNSRETARMSDLIRRRGLTEAEGIRNRNAPWSDFATGASGLLSDLIKTKADEPRKKLQAAQEERVQNQLAQEAELDAIVKANRDPEARADALEQAGFMAQAKAVRDQIEAEVAKSNTKQFTALQATYGQDNPDEVIKQGMAVAPEKTLAFEDRQRGIQKDEEAKAEKEDTRKMTQALRLSSVMTSVSNLWGAQKIESQEQLDSLLKTSRKIAEDIGHPELIENISPIFAPARTEKDRQMVVAWSGKQEKDLNEFQGFKATYIKEHGEPKDTAGYVALMLAWDKANPKDEKKDSDAFKDNPKLPIEVDQYLGSMLNRGYTREQAETELSAGMPSLLRQYPKLSWVELRKAVDVMWKVTASTGETFDPATKERVTVFRNAQPPVTPRAPLSALVRPSPVASHSEPSMREIGPMFSKGPQFQEAGPMLSKAPIRPSSGPTLDEAKRLETARSLIAQIQQAKNAGQDYSDLVRQLQAIRGR